MSCLKVVIRKEYIRAVGLHVWIQIETPFEKGPNMLALLITIQFRGASLGAPDLS